MKPQIRVISLNVRFAYKPDENMQELREPRIADFAASALPHSFGFQECTSFWRDRFDATLTNYKRVQEHPKSPDTFKNYIYYNPDKAELLDGGKFWLSETPDEPSCGFGSRFYISCSWALLKDIKTGAVFMHMNTHLDASGNQFRVPETEVLLGRVKNYSEKYPLILTGDFNSAPTDIAYQTVSSCGFLKDFKIGLPAPMLDYTFNGYMSDQEEPDKREYIDYGFCNDKIIPLGYDIIAKWKDKYMSDHNALIFDFTL